MPSAVPLMERAEQAAHDVVLRRGIAQLLTVASSVGIDRTRRGRPQRRKGGDQMLRSRQEIHPHVVGERKIPCAVDARVGERRRPPAAPVLDGRVRVEDLGPLLGAIRRLQPSMHAVGVGFVRIGKWKARRSEHITVARRRESLIVRSARRACDVDPHRVEHPPVLLVRVEAVVQELTQEAASLRLAVGIRGTAAHGEITSIAEGRCRVADGGEPNAGDDRAGRAIRDPIPATGIESAVELNPGWCAVAGDETPSLSSDDGGLVPEAISNRQTILRARRVRRWIHHRRSHRIIDEERFRRSGRSQSHPRRVLQFSRWAAAGLPAGRCATRRRGYRLPIRSTRRCSRPA